LLQELEVSNGGQGILANSTARSGWPTHGMYFFFERGEFRHDGSSRVVRVGTRSRPRGRRLCGVASHNIACGCRAATLTEAITEGRSSANTSVPHFYDATASHQTCSPAGSRKP
jgi:hypothetical protein